MTTALQLADYIEYAGLPFKKEGRYLRSLEHDSLVIDQKNNYFNWNSRGLVGNLTEFIACYYDIDQRDVHYRLKDFRHRYQPKTNQQHVEAFQSQHSQVAAQLPLDQAGRAYLTRKRGLKPELINFLAVQGLISSDQDHNVIFNWFDQQQNLVGQDVQGTVIDPHRFGKRGTCKRIVAGSRPHFGFNIRFRGTFDHLYIFESPIDLLSYWQLYAGELANTQLLSLSGASSKLQTIDTYLQDELALTGLPAYIHLAPDNDPAGRELIQKFTQVRLHDHDKHCRSLVEWSQAKDWNEQIQTKRTEAILKYTFDSSTFDYFQLFNKIRRFDHDQSKN